MATPVFALIPIIVNLLKKIGGKLLKKGAEKVVEKGAEKVAEKGLEVGAKKFAEGVIPKLTTGKVGEEFTKNVDWLNKIKPLGYIGKNIAQSAPELSKRNTLSDILNFASGNLDKMVEGKAKPTFTPTETGGNIQKSKVSKFIQNALGGESFGSKLFLNTLSNLGQSGAFRGSDVGESDRDFGSSLANSLASSLGQSAMQQKRQNYEDRQNILNMVNDTSFSEELYKEWSPENLKVINGLRSDLIEMMYNNRKRGINGLTSDDRMNAQMKYIDIKKQLDNFTTGVKQYQDAEMLIGKDANNTYDIDFFRNGREYIRKYGRAPAEGFIKYAAKDPKIVFSENLITPISKWSKAAPENNFMRHSNTTDEIRQLRAVEYLNGNMGIRRWAEENGYNPNSTRDQIRFGLDYGKYFDQPIPDEAARSQYEQRQEHEGEMREEREWRREFSEEGRRLSEERRNETAQNKLDYTISGDEVIFTENVTKNIEKSKLVTLIPGVKIIADEDELIPIKFESIDKYGNLYVSATVKKPKPNDPTKEEPSLRKFKIPAETAKEFVGKYYPEIWSKLIPTKKEETKGVLKIEKLREKYVY